jgi:hypothetical protein
MSGNGDHHLQAMFLAGELESDLKTRVAVCIPYLTPQIGDVAQICVAAIANIKE